MRVRALPVAVLLVVLVGCGVPATEPPAVTTPTTAPSPTVALSSPPPTSASPTSASPTPSATPVAPAEPSNPTTVPIATPSPLPPDPAKLPGAPAGSRGVVYLTFDDGPSTYTRAVLDILTKTASTATFFELGINQRSYPDLVHAVRAQGSAIGNHTYDHRDLTTLSDAAVRSELRRGPTGARCVRPPYGATNRRVLRLIEQFGAEQIQWSDDTIDWDRPGARAIYLRAAGPQVVNGSIVLMHDGGGDRSETVAALPKIIAELQRRGYLIRRLPGC